MVIREIAPADYPVLEEFLYNAIFIPEGAKLPPRKVIFAPEIYVYIKDFDINNRGDCGIIAEISEAGDNKIIGAAWARIIPAYGHIDDETPELAISTSPDWRNKGVGSAMMIKLFDLLRLRGFKRTSLSVQKENPAVRFYERLGYEVIESAREKLDHEDYIMAKKL